MRNGASKRKQKNQKLLSTRNEQGNITRVQVTNASNHSFLALDVRCEWKWYIPTFTEVASILLFFIYSFFLCVSRQSQMFSFHRQSIRLMLLRTLHFPSVVHSCKTNCIWFKSSCLLFATAQQMSEHWRIKNSSSSLPSCVPWYSTDNVDKETELWCWLNQNSFTIISFFLVFVRALLSGEMGQQCEYVWIRWKREHLMIQIECQQTKASMYARCTQ